MRLSVKIIVGAAIVAASVAAATFGASAPAAAEQSLQAPAPQTTADMSARERSGDGPSRLDAVAPCGGAAELQPSPAAALLSVCAGPRLFPSVTAA